MGGEPRFVGIDVSKAQVDVAVRPTGRRWVMSYDEAGSKELVSQMVDLGPALVLLEATGGLELPLVAALAAAALPVVVVNPRQVRDFARATGTLAKTDSLRGSPGSLRRRGSSLGAPSQGRRGPGPQLADCPPAPGDDHAGLREEPTGYCHQRGASSHRDPHRLVGQELRDLDQELRQSLRRSPVWREKDDLLRTVPGVGEQLSLTLLADRPSWALWTDGRSRPWWAWRPSTGTAVPCAADAPSGADAPGFGVFSTWER